MKETFSQKIERFIECNVFEVGRVKSLTCKASQLEGTIVINDDVNPNNLIFPQGLEFIEDIDEDTETKTYFIEDKESGDYEQIMFAHQFWAAYAEEVKLCKALEEVYSM